MMLDARTVREMPIRLPRPAVIRRSIAEKAAESRLGSPEYFLQLIGPVEPAFVGGEGREASWRLAHYQGSPDEHAAIERAVGLVQRLTPLMSAI